MDKDNDPINYIEKIREIVDSSGEFIETKNYYFNNHICKTGENVKVNLDFSIENDNSDISVRIGKCPYCNTTFYHKTYKKQSL